MILARRRRRQARDSAAQQQEHLAARIRVLEALAAAFERRQEVLAVIFEAADVDTARSEIRRLLGVGEEGADLVLDVSLRRFTVAERLRIRAELDALHLERTRLPL